MVGSLAFQARGHGFDSRTWYAVTSLVSLEDKASGYEPEDREFESLTRHVVPWNKEVDMHGPYIPVGTILAIVLIVVLVMLIA